MTQQHSTSTTAPRFDRRPEPSVGCAACGSTGLDIFYEIDSVPANSCVLIPTEAETAAFPTGRIRLALCPVCGFIGNTAFNPAVMEYSSRYEPSQGFSPTFRAFARSLAQRLADRYSLRGKTVMEIGCGQGEFLSLLCDVAGSRGIGIDPAYDPVRTVPSPSGPLEFIREPFGPSQASLRPDLICCRHTLEHIQTPGLFIRQVREAIALRTDVAVVFEVPDTGRILREGAFWDIYHEHCAYFTAGSLARLFRSSRFEITSLSLEYAGQYIVLEAAATDRPTSARLELEEDLDDIIESVGAFQRRCAPTIKRWLGLIDQWGRAGERAVLWGSGSKAVSFLTTLGIHRGIRHVVDLNPSRYGTFCPLTGQRIVAPSELKEIQPHHVVVMNPVYMREIDEELHRLGVSARLWPL